MEKALPKGEREKDSLITRFVNSLSCVTSNFTALPCNPMLLPEFRELASRPGLCGAVLPDEDNLVASRLGLGLTAFVGVIMNQELTVCG